jgi:hypothetical protein
MKLEVPSPLLEQQTLLDEEISPGFLTVGMAGTNLSGRVEKVRSSQSSKEFSQASINRRISSSHKCCELSKQPWEMEEYSAEMLYLKTGILLSCKDL